MKMLLLSVVMLVICIADVRASTGCDLSNRVLSHRDILMSRQKR